MRWPSSGTTEEGSSPPEPFTTGEILDPKEWPELNTPPRGFMWRFLKDGRRASPARMTALRETGQPLPGTIPRRVALGDRFGHAILVPIDWTIDVFNVHFNLNADEAWSPSTQGGIPSSDTPPSAEEEASSRSPSRSPEPRPRRAHDPPGGSADPQSDLAPRNAPGGPRPSSPSRSRSFEDPPLSTIPKNPGPAPTIPTGGPFGQGQPCAQPASLFANIVPAPGNPSETARLLKRLDERNQEKAQRERKVLPAPQSRTAFPKPPSVYTARKAQHPLLYRTTMLGKGGANQSTVEGEGATPSTATKLGDHRIPGGTTRSNNWGYNYQDNRNRNSSQNRQSTPHPNGNPNQGGNRPPGGNGYRPPAKPPTEVLVFKAYMKDGKRVVKINEYEMDFFQFQGFCRMNTRCFKCGQGHRVRDCPAKEFLFPRPTPKTGSAPLGTANPAGDSTNNGPYRKLSALEIASLSWEDELHYYEEAIIHGDEIEEIYDEDNDHNGVSINMLGLCEESYRGIGDSPYRTRGPV